MLPLLPVPQCWPMLHPSRISLLPCSLPANFTPWLDTRITWKIQRAVGAQPLSQISEVRDPDMYMYVFKTLWVFQCHHKERTMDAKILLLSSHEPSEEDGLIRICRCRPPGMWGLSPQPDSYTLDCLPQPFLKSQFLINTSQLYSRIN